MSVGRIRYSTSVSVLIRKACLDRCCDSARALGFGTTYKPAETDKRSASRTDIAFCG